MDTACFGGSAVHALLWGVGGGPAGFGFRPTSVARAPSWALADQPRIVLWRLCRSRMPAPSLLGFQ